MRIVDIRERTMPISRFGDAGAGGAAPALTTSLVSVATECVRDGTPVVGYRYGSIGRYAQGGLIRERFAPRLLAAEAWQIGSASGDDLDACWAVMMTGASR